MRFYHKVVHPKDVDGIANSVDPDQTAPLDLIWVYAVYPDLSVKKIGTLGYTESSQGII